jgi:hypothetical protein
MATNIQTCIYKRMDVEVSGPNMSKRETWILDDMSCPSQIKGPWTLETSKACLKLRLWLGMKGGTAAAFIL